uniref:Uncharacterized protein n=1 Tax=Podarcis muralis TaxID=64176 RepID=A0A670JZ23_PODMU
MPSRLKFFRGQRYQHLKKRCLQQQSLFEDPEFPATNASSSTAETLCPAP